jgi:fructokinase
MDVLCLGEALIDFVALETGVGVGEASGFLKAPGGAPANVAVGVARLGGSAGFIGRVGEDPFGHFLRDTFAENGVDTSGMSFDKEARTGLAFVSLQADGERDFSFFRNPSADMRLAPAHLDRNLIGSARVYHFGSITQIDEPARSATLAALKIAREAGCIISYDPNLRPPLWPGLDEARKTIRAMLPLVDVAKLSDEELLFVTGAEDLQTAMDLWFNDGSRPPLTVVTEGANGCTYLHGTAGQKIAGYKVGAVDATGAGDGFVAGMLVRLLNHVEKPADIAQITPDAFKEIFSYANAVGALTTTKKGAIPALPTVAQVEQFLTQAIQN